MLGATHAGRHTAGDRIGTGGSTVEHDIAIGLAAILGIGVTVQWIATRLGLPAIIFLLAAGVIAGPVTGFIDPDVILDDLLFPAISLGVAILLFEGGFELRLSRLDVGRTTVIRLVTIGVLITWILGAGATTLFFDTSIGLSLLIGAILTVSGPTVVLPLLRQARLKDSVASVLRWEGIVVDPIGALLAVTVLEAVLNESAVPAVAVLASVLVGVGVGAVAAGGMMLALREHWIPDRLQIPVVLMVVVVANTVASEIRPETGLIAATVLGIVLANQTWAPAGHIADFTESLGPIVLASLFIVLGARVDLDDLAEVVVPGLGVVGCLLVIRLLVAFVSTVGTGLTWRERAFIGVMAPRGIVAAAVASLFLLELEEAGKPDDPLVPLIFFVITATVIIYGLGAKPLSKLLKVAKVPPRGLAFVGAPDWVRDLAELLEGEDVPVLLITADGDEIDAAAARGQLVYGGKLDARDLSSTLDGVGIREAIVGSNNDELNELAIERLSDHLGRSHVYLLPRSEEAADELVQAGGDVAAAGRRPFGDGVTQHDLEQETEGGARIDVRRVGPDGAPAVDSDRDLLLLVLKGDASVVIVREGASVDLVEGDRIVVATDLADPARFRSQASEQEL